jgi:hypothetical protein
MKISLIKPVLLALVLAISLEYPAQTKKTKPTVKPPVKPAPVVTATPQPTPETVPTAAVKKNERPGKPSGGIDQSKAVTRYTPTYFYQFERPGFTVSKVNIEHDEMGRGQISFLKEEFDAPLVDPIELSPVTLENLKASFAALNFVDSTENYQYERDFTNMGNVTITLKRDGRERTAKYNWTENKDAKVLMDEYRRITNEYVWHSDIVSARENQPLLTPGLIDAIDLYFSRNELTDPPHLIPFLTSLSNDERLPLIARNHITRLIKRIEKPAK